MKTSQTGVDLIKSFEGCRLLAYKCLPTEKYFTIGYGHYGADVRFGQRITQIEAEAMLKTDLVKYEQRVAQYDHIYHFNQNEFDALVSFCYNVGSINQLTANGTRTRDQIREAMPKYCKAGGNVLKGLVRRRAAELELFNKQDAQQTTTPTLEEVAKAVIRGVYGNGAERKKRIPAETPYKYSEVQKLVNKMLKG